MKTISFSPWYAMGTLPFQADFSKHMQEGFIPPSPPEWFPASVPGCIYQDLRREGRIPDPYFRENSLACEWVANRWWIYRTTFTVSEEDLRGTLRLCFEGIDYAAQIYLNGHRLGRHEGMYIPFEAVINRFVKPGTENILVCVLEHAPFADPQPGYTSKTRWMKARFNYKWDFAVRLVSLGLYGKVTLTRHGIASIAHSYVRPVKGAEGWRVEMELELEVYREGEAEIAFRLDDPQTGHPVKFGAATVALHCAGGSPEQPAFQSWHGSFPMEDPLLWWPNGYGEQVLYPFHLCLSEGQELSDEIIHQVGFRTLEYRHADGREDALPYNVVVNGKRIYLKGTNMVPLDCMTGAVTPGECRQKLRAAKDANINFLRIWGGGHIESEEYYRLCDEFGLMLLQEFPMSSSGCDDVPSKNPEFLRLLHRAAVHNMKVKRNHVCLIFWDGGNELTDGRYLGREDHEGHPASFDDSTLAMLKGLCDHLCPGIQMLPSSASGPRALLDPDKPGQNHDVHGPWGFMGAEGHYTLYNTSDSIVHGEFGCGGMSGYDAICRFTEEADRQLYTSQENRVWAHHSGGWDTYATRERLLFGSLKEIPFKDYIKVSQFIQAEALRYALEANRRRQWWNVGEMTWQFNEPWPNMQCSNVLDYYGGKKLAWYAMRGAYAPVLASLRYDKLLYRPGEEFHGGLYLLSDLPGSSYTIRWEVVSCAGEILAQGTEQGSIPEDTSMKVCDLDLVLPSELSGGFVVRLETVCGEFRGRKEYLLLIANRIEEIPLTDAEKRRLSGAKGLANPLDAPRAAVEPVIDYVDRWLAAEEGGCSLGS